MIFPFSIKYSKILTPSFSQNKDKVVLEFIKDFIEKKSGDDIVINDRQLTFRSRFFKSGRWNSNILVPIERGVFKLADIGGRTILTYEFFMYHLFIFVTIFAVFLMTISQHMWVGFIIFLWIGGINWIVTIIRHRLMIKKIVMGIDNLLKETNIKDGNH